MRKPLFILLFSVIAISAILFGIVAYIYKDATTEYIWKDNTANMKNNQAGYYALSKFLQKQAAPTKMIHISSMKKFEKYKKQKNNAILFVGNGNFSNKHFSNSNLDILLKWVEDGNHLYIKESKYLNEKLNIKFNNFPVKKQKNQYIQAACEKKYNQLKQQYSGKFPKFMPNDYMENCSLNLSIFRLPENQQDIFILETPIEKLKHIGGFDISKTPNVISTAKTADDIVTVVRIKKGKGTITVVGTYELFAHPEEPTNIKAIHLNSFDNAYFAAYLAQGKSVIYSMSPKNNDKKNDEFEKNLPLWWQLLKKYPLPVTLFVLMIIAAVWQYARRLGGTRRYQNLAEKQITAHFAAQGRLIAHQNEHYALLCEWQNTLLQEWQQKFGRFSQHNPRQNAVLIAKQLGVSPNDVEMWLHPIPDNLRPNDILRFVRSHQQLRKQQQ